jgi:hypothetical protein
MLNTVTATASGRPRFGFFNPETTTAMGLAFERAWQMIQISREPILAEYGSLPRPEELARVILDLAKQGERVSAYPGKVESRFSGKICANA